MQNKFTLEVVNSMLEMSKHGTWMFLSKEATNDFKLAMTDSLSRVSAAFYEDPRVVALLHALRAYLIKEEE